MSAAPKAPTPDPRHLAVQLITVDGGDGSLQLVVTSPGEVRRLAIRPEELAPFQAAMQALPAFLRTHEIPPSTPRDELGRVPFVFLPTGRMGLTSPPDDRGPEVLAMPQELPRVLWIHPDEVETFVAAFDRLVAAARRNGMLPEVAG